MALYAAYGSNMDPSHMLQRCPSSPVAGTGWLPGWRLTFGGEDLSWDGAMSMVVEDPDSAVFVVLYDMADSDERMLDSWEGADLGLYSKIRLRVTPWTVTCWPGCTRSRRSRRPALGALHRGDR